MEISPNHPIYRWSVHQQTIHSRVISQLSTLLSIVIWRFPEMVVHLKDPFYIGIFNVQKGFKPCADCNICLYQCDTTLGIYQALLGSKVRALCCTGYEPNPQPLKPVLPSRGPHQVRYHLQCFEVLAWIR